ncbi:MAG TPA: hypothetical protein ENI34_06720 [candidate division WOR-3 bacterium]|uniref:O-antigen ligase domain-containing protein n=1 Tax=candidate division WOR-3 bacterium TaxID=2052148 RepID=A0A9C9K0F4_UNCW3|nr:hypothetical protein [candidate division WOR-3 bacterium]
MINGADILPSFGSIILYTRYPLLFIALVNMDLKEKVIGKFILLFLLLIILQIPECTLRYLLGGVYGDHISWSLGPWGQFDLGIYAMYTLCLSVANGVVKGFKIMHLIFIGFLFILALLGEIKAFLLASPIVVIITIYFSLRQKKAKGRLLAVVLPLLSVVILYYAIHVWGYVHRESSDMLAVYFEKVTQIFKNPTIFFHTEEVDATSSRIFGSAYIWGYLRRDWKMILFGAGPGSLLAGNFLGNPGKIFDVVPYLNQLSVTLGETGVVGLVIYLWMLINIFRKIIFVNKTALSDKNHILSAALIGMWFFYTILGPIYDLVWRHDSPNFIFYVLIAYLYSSFVYKTNSPKNVPV